MSEQYQDVKENRLVPLVMLYPHKRNYRSHPPEQIRKLKASLERFGQVRSIVCQQNEDSTYTIVAGHGVFEAAKALKYDKLRADILPSWWSSEQIAGYLVADNNLNADAVDDTSLLAALLEEQKDAGYDLASLGADEEVLAQMLQELGDIDIDEHEELGEPDDTIPEHVETRVKPEEIWQLGKHRIACLDALKEDTYTHLLSGALPDAIITDAPYGMRLDTDFSGMQNKLQFIQDKGVKSGRKYTQVIGDHQDFDASLIVSLFSHVKEQFWFGADYYSSTLGDTMHTGCWLVWDKRLDESADRMYGSCFELIWSKQKHKRDMLRHKWAGIFGTEHEPQRGRQHPTQKPVRLLEDIITRYTSKGQIILDPFLGSGTTLISAERTDRIVYGCELSPAYCDVILARWEQESGKKAQCVREVAKSA